MKWDNLLQKLKNFEMNCQLVLQENIAQNDFDELKSICDDIGVDCVPVYQIPFDNKLSDFPKTKHSLFYGSTTLCNLAYNDAELKQGVFYNPNTFTIQNYNRNWKQFMFNNDATILSVEQILATVDHDRLYFVRPNDDNKFFAGNVKSFTEIKEMFQNILKYDNSIDLTSLIVLSEPGNIETEYRLWIRDGKVISASKYRSNFILKPEQGCPEAVYVFAETMCRIYTPHDMFVMDICVVKNVPYILECNCMNASGFYKGDKKVILQNMVECLDGENEKNNPLSPSKSNLRYIK